MAIIEELDGASEPDSKDAIIRREGLYSSHVTEWRRLRALGGLAALGRSRGPRSSDSLVVENERLRDKVRQPEARLSRAEEAIVDASPAATCATLLDEGTYLASERTMYRLAGADEVVSAARSGAIPPMPSLSS